MNIKFEAREWGWRSESGKSIVAVRLVGESWHVWVHDPVGVPAKLYQHNNVGAAFACAEKEAERIESRERQETLERTFVQG